MYSERGDPPSPSPYRVRLLCHGTRQVQRQILRLIRTEDDTAHGKGYRIIPSLAKRMPTRWGNTKCHLRYDSDVGKCGLRIRCHVFLFPHVTGVGCAWA